MKQGFNIARNFSIVSFAYKDEIEQCRAKDQQYTQENLEKKKRPPVIERSSDPKKKRLNY